MEETVEKFPASIKPQGLEEENVLLFWSKKMDGKNETNVLMKAGKGFVEKIEEPVEIVEKLPVYIQLMSRYIFTGMLEA